MVEHFKSILEEISKYIKTDIENSKNFNIFLKLYNFWQNEERGGIETIYNIHSQEDLKYLVNNDILDAAKIYSLYQSEKKFIICDGKNYEELERSDIWQIIKSHIDDILPCVIKYAPRCGKDSPYAAIYEEYITNTLEAYEF